MSKCCAMGSSLGVVVHVIGVDVLRTSSSSSNVKSPGDTIGGDCDNLIDRRTLFGFLFLDDDFTGDNCSVLTI